MSQQREHWLLQHAVSHLEWLRTNDRDALDLGLPGVAWRHLPPDEAAAVERACGWFGRRCEHGWFSRCQEQSCKDELNRAYAAIIAERDAEMYDEREAERHDHYEEP